MSWRSVFSASLVLMAFTCLCALGWWQIERGRWKADINAQRQARHAQAIVPWQEDFSDSDLRDLTFRRFTLNGRLDWSMPLRVQSHDAQRGVGWRLFLPLFFEEEDRRGLLVDLGWQAPLGKAAPPSIFADGPASDGLRVRLRQGGWQGISWLRPDHGLSPDLWLWLDLPAMARAVGLEATTSSYYLEVIAPGSVLAPLPAHHKGYAVTWFSLAGALIILVLFSRRRFRVQ